MQDKGYDQIGAEGVYIRHSRSCPSHKGGECSAGRPNGCRIGYVAGVYAKQRGDQKGRKIKKTFRTVKAAREWREGQRVKQREGKSITPAPRTLRKSSEEFIAGAKQGAIRPKDGEPYKPSAIRGYELSLFGGKDANGKRKGGVLDDLGNRKLTDVTHSDLVALVERMQRDGASGSTIRNALTAARMPHAAPSCRAPTSTSGRGQTRIGTSVRWCSTRTASP